ncbi:hypothetical protein Tco_0433292 [Tanacetum coccineum]
MVVPLLFTVNIYHDGVFQHNGYDTMEMIAEELHPKKHVSHVDSDSDVETNHPLDDVAHVVEQFKHEDEGNVIIPRMTIDDPWLKKLVGNDTFIGQTENPNPNLQGRFLLEVEDHNDEQVEFKFKAKKNVSYPSFNPDTSCNECKPVLEIRDVSKGSKKGDDRKAVNEKISKAVKERWDKKKDYEKKRVSKQANCPFRLWAS